MVRDDMPTLALFNEIIWIFHEMRPRLLEVRNAKGQVRRGHLLGATG